MKLNVCQAFQHLVEDLSDVFRRHVQFPKQKYTIRLDNIIFQSYMKAVLRRQSIENTVFLSAFDETVELNFEKIIIRAGIYLRAFSTEGPLYFLARLQSKSQKSSVQSRYIVICVVTYLDII